MLPPRLHGRDHRPNGPDPIPRSPLSGIETIAAGSVLVNSLDPQVFSFAHVSGPTLVDLTTPTDPAILLDGIYAIQSATVEIDVVTTQSGTYFVSQIVFTGATLGSTVYQNINTTAAGQSWENIAIGYMAAGTSFECTVVNNDPVDDLHFSCSVVVSQIA